MFKKKSSEYNHDAPTIAKACKVSQKRIRRKQNQLNDFIVGKQLKTRNEISRSRVVEKLEKLFTKRELAFIVQQYSEMIQRGNVKPLKMKKEQLDDDPSII